jgi:hypothetical protein
VLLEQATAYIYTNIMMLAAAIFVSSAGDS